MRSMLKSFLLAATLTFGFVIGSAQAQEYPRFEQPVAEQTGMYTVQVLDGDTATDLEFSGGILEVLEPYSVVFGYTVPVNHYIVWGTVQTPDIYLTYQSAPTQWFDYERRIDVQAGRAVATATGYQIEILGSGELVFDPRNQGQGKVFDIELVFDAPTRFYGQDRTQLHLRFNRTQSNAFITACDRGDIDAGGFLPLPNPRSCN